MSKKLAAPQTPGEGQIAGKRAKKEEFADTRVDPTERRQLAIKTLLESLPIGVDDKLATVKAAHHVDKERFQSAFRSLMRDAKQ